MWAGRRGLGALLAAAGAALLLLAAGSFAWGRARAPAPEPATHAASGTAPATVALGPTAAAAATRLPAPTPIPTAGAAAVRRSAPVRLVIGAVGIDARVVEVGWRLVQRPEGWRGVWDTVAGAAGHHRGSADPGQRGNCVISAHSSEAGEAVFRRLEQLVPGDEVGVETVGGERYVYVAAEVLRLDEFGATEAERRAHARLLDPTAGPTLTLVTCWPDWSYTHRIVVRAVPRAP